MLDEKDLIQKISEFKKIQPNHDWVFWLKANIFEIGQQKILVKKPKIKLVSFFLPFRSGQAFISKYQKTLIPAFLGLFFIFTFSFAQATLPGNVLYPIKTLTQEARIYLASESAKPVVRLEVAKARMEDLSKVHNHEIEISAMIKTINKDLGLVPQEIKKIDKKQLVLDVSKNVQEKSKDLQLIAEKITLGEDDKKELTRTVENTQNQVLALIIQTTDEINQCPSFLSNNLIELSEYFADTEKAMLQWTPDQIIKAKALLIEAGKVLKTGDCSAAMERIESIKQLLSIHSLDSSTQNSFGQIEVETSFPENLDENSSIIPPKEESMEE